MLDRIRHGLVKPRYNFFDDFLSNSFFISTSFLLLKEAQNKNLMYISKKYIIITFSFSFRFP